MNREWSNISKIPMSVQDTACTNIKHEIHVTGGFNTTRTDINIVYNTFQDTWKSLKVMMRSNSCHTSCSKDSNLYTICGENVTGYLDTIDKYNKITNSWNIENQISEGIKNTASVVYKNNIYIICGETASQLGIPRIYKYDIISHTCSTITISKSKGRHIAELYGSKIYIQFGYNNDNIAYDIDTNTCKIYTKSTKLISYATSGIINDDIYTIGGIDGNVDDNVNGNITIYNISTDTWRRYKSLDYTIRNASGMSLYNDIYIFGGKVDNKLTDKAAKYTEMTSSVNMLYDMLNTGISEIKNLILYSNN